MDININNWINRYFRYAESPPPWIRFAGNELLFKMCSEEKRDFILVSWIPSGKIRPVHIHFFVLNFILRFYPSILLNRYREITCVVTPDVTPSIDYSINILWMGTTSFKPKWVFNFRICIFIMKNCLNFEWKEKQPRVFDYIYIDYGIVSDGRNPFSMYRKLSLRGTKLFWKFNQLNWPFRRTGTYK